MIKVELLEDQRCVATMTVEDDGSYSFDDPLHRFPTPLHVLVPRGDRDLEKVHLEDDPATWARNLGNLMRTPYLWPVIVHDDGLPARRQR